MAAQQGVFGRSVSRLIAWLAVPRVILLPLLVAGGVAAGQLLWLYVDSPKMLAWIGGVASPFCMMCATAVWAMRDRMESGLDIDDMSTRSYQNLIAMVAQHRARSTFWAGATALMALLSSTPTISNQLIGPVWHWMVLGCTGAVAFSVHAYLLANYWEQQIRAHRNQQRLEIKQAQERLKLLNELTTPGSVSQSKGWVDGPALTIVHPASH